jgi:Fic family protein
MDIRRIISNLILKMYIHQRADWANFKWDNEAIITLLGEVRHLQGRLLGNMNALGFPLQNQAILEILTLDVIKNNEIEGEFLNGEEVRSSIARRLGLDFSSNVHPSRYVEGVVEMMLDATQNYDLTLTKERLFNWHAALFPTGRSGMYPITIADWRKDDKGPMQVVSGAWRREKVHFEAPHSDIVDTEMEQFLNWFNAKQPIDDIIKAAIAHLWLVTIHPFDDGNGRITRAITDMQLARSDKSKQRFYSMSNQVLLERKAYYILLEMTQKGSLDITSWIIWFLELVKKAIIDSETLLSKVIQKAKFGEIYRETSFNARQHHMINILLDDFFGKLTTKKWAKMNKCSTDTALRDIQDLEQKNVLLKENSGKNTFYKLKPFI